MQPLSTAPARQSTQQCAPVGVVRRVRLSEVTAGAWQVMKAWEHVCVRALVLPDSLFNHPHPCASFLCGQHEVQARV